MKRYSLLLVSLFLIAGCGKPSPDKILQKMNQATLKNYDQNLSLVEIPEMASTSLVMTLTNESVAKKFEAKGNLVLKVNNEYDVSDNRNPLIATALDLKVVVDATAGFFAGGPAVKSGPKTQSSADLAIGLKSAGRKIFFNLAKLEVSVPGALPVPFALPPNLQSKWYGATFDEINTELKQNSDTGSVVPTVEQLLTKALAGGGIDKKPLRKFISRMHIWKGIETLPEENGVLRVKVESDKNAIAEDIAAMTDYMMETANISWEQFQNSSGLNRQKYFGTIKTDIEKNEGSIRGILSADKDTYVFRGFTGEIFSNSGAKLGDVNIQISKNQDMLVEFTGATNGKKAVFTKTGADYSLIVDGIKLVAGTVSDKRFTMTAWDQKQNIVLTADLPIEKVAKDEISIKNGEIFIQPLNLKLKIDRYFTKFENSFKDFSFNIDLIGLFEDAPVFTAKIEAGRKEQKKVEVIPPPAFSPFSELQQDLLGVFMGSAQGIENSLPPAAGQ
ncbi:hypothetical protein A3C52_03955 [Candidatus Peribacteria bacterium RIFCSPHIGHO2_02_FULL_51_15]|nr:MAG: hypothetical protein A3C52_03955 [Candidatus Peribacteria bacterium RIFCSPHIGHO2_02_FULL_51_15]